MTGRTAAGARAALVSPARQPAGSRKPFLAMAFADPRIRLGTAATVILVTAMAARRQPVGPCETQAFRAINELPDSLYPPAWLAMQLGALGAVPAAAGTAALAGQRELAGRLLVSGAGTWALAKLVKQVVRRPRPAALLSATRCRGRQTAGLGYLSGHAGVAAALAVAALPRLGPAGRAVVLIAVPVVGLTRIYAGAHLPLDVAGGAALGFAVDAAVAVAGRPARRTSHVGRLRRPMVPLCKAARPCHPFGTRLRLDLEGPFLSKHAPPVRKERTDGR